MNMKKSVMASAVVAALALPLANASNVFISPDGSGDALLFPYYSVNQGNRTFINITNTRTDAKVVKVRFRDGVGSRDIFDFTLFLSPQDYWVGAIRREGDSVIINTPDNSCAAPMIKGSVAAFNPQRFDPDYTARTAADRLSEGHVEILEMATLDNGVDDDVYPAIVHDAAGIPGGDETCATSTQWETEMATQASSGNHANGTTFAYSATSVDDVTGGTVIQDLNPATGGLAGFAATFNPTDGTWFTSSATPLNNYNDGVKFFVQEAVEWDALNVLSTDSGLTADGGDVEYFDLPDLSTPGADTAASGTTQNAQIYQSNGTTLGLGWNNTGTNGAVDNVNVADDAAENMRNSVTGALMKGKLAADYITSEGFATELVLTFPTRYLHLDVRDATEDRRLDVAPPFTIHELDTNGEACHDITNFFTDREEKKRSGGITFSPGSSTSFQLCFEVNVIAFNQTATAFSGVLASGAVAKYVALPAGFTDGWIALDFRGFNMAADSGGTLNGFPLAGFVALADKKTAVRRGATASISLEPAN